MYVAGVARAFGYFLPNFFRSSEIYEDTLYTRVVNMVEEPVQTGDIIGFWKEGEVNPKKIHVGIIRKNAEGIDILHASRKEGQVVATALHDMLRQSEYARIACVKRGLHLIQGLENPTDLRRLGFWDLRRSYPCENE